MQDRQTGVLPVAGGKVITLGSIARPYPHPAPSFRLLRAKTFVEINNQNKFRKESGVWPGAGEPALRGGDERNELIQAGEEKMWREQVTAFPWQQGGYWGVGDRLLMSVSEERVWNSRCKLTSKSSNRIQGKALCP